MSNYNKVKNEGMEEFHHEFGFPITEPVKVQMEGNGNSMIIGVKELKMFLSTFADKVKEAVEEENAQSLKDILNRCKTDRGLGVAIANFIKTLTK